MKYSPKISVITPSFNQGHFIEETINSVLDQGYPNLEYIIIDGGSSDNTIEIIKEYERHLSYWVSEKDKGQSDAINKGLKIATGEVVNWLNSDDYYMPGALHHVASVFKDPHVNAYCGRSRIFSETSAYLSQGTDLYPGSLPKTIGWARIDQPETFFRKKVWNYWGRVNQSFHYVMDKELWVRFLLAFGSECVFRDGELLVNFRIHNASKTGSQTDQFKRETNDLFYPIAANNGLAIAKDFHKFSSPKAVDLFGYREVAPEVILTSIHYYFLLLVLESYASNDYPKALIISKMIDKNLLDSKDVAELKKVLFRIKVLPVSVKRWMNQIR